MKLRSFHFKKILIIIFIFVFTGCNKENIPPVASFTITPEQGDLEDFFVFNASTSYDDKDDMKDLRVRWDWESDGRWDTQFSTNKIIQKQFSNPTTYTITLQVRNTRDNISQISKELLVMGKITGTFIDPRDEKSYKTIKIGDQLWMAENLNYKITDGSWCYDDDISNSDIYGRLYCFPSIIYACPGGWHLPSDKEWQELESFLGMHWRELDHYGIRYTGKVGDKLRSDYGWYLEMNGTNECKFNALPGGHYVDHYVYEDGIQFHEIGYDEIGLSTLFFTGTESWNGSYIVRRLYTGKGVERLSWKANERAYIRCVKD